MNTEKTGLEKETPADVNTVLDVVFSVVLQGVNMLGWMVVIYLILFIIIGGDFSISIKWENLRDFLGC